jgi:hypothetical protein
VWDDRTGRRWRPAGVLRAPVAPADLKLEREVERLQRSVIVTAGSGCVRRVTEGLRRWKVSEPALCRVPGSATKERSNVGLLSRHVAAQARR